MIQEMIEFILYFIFIHLTLFIPGYIILSLYRKEMLLVEKITFSYLVSLAIFSLLVICWVFVPVSSLIFRILAAVFFGTLIYIAIKKQIFSNFTISKYHLCFIFFSAFSLVYVSFPINTSTYIPDPQPMTNRNYSVFNVKMLNLAHTPANDNYIPFRQAQFIINRLDINNTSFISEWGVNFFFRTPLMGVISSFLLLLTGINVPVDYLWSGDNFIYNNSYIKYQIIVQILNSLYLLPSFLIIKNLFNKKIAWITCLLLLLSPFFLYNNFFSWPKSLVAYFILASWYLLIHKKNYVLSAITLGMSFWAHDLTMIYFAGSSFYLLYSKRSFRDYVRFSIIYMGILFPWYFTSKIVYHQSSLFFYYPFSLYGIPTNPNLVFQEFFSTSIYEIIYIKIKSLYYLLLPYHLLHNSEQKLIQSLWVDNIFSIAGSVGLPLITFSYYAILKYLRRFWLVITSTIVVPLISIVSLIGWSFDVGGMGSMHFSQAIVVILTAFAVKLIVDLNIKWIFYTLCLLSILNALIIILYNYDFNFDGWINDILIYLKIIFIFLYFLTITLQLKKSFNQ